MADLWEQAASEYKGPKKAAASSSSQSSDPWEQAAREHAATNGPAVPGTEKLGGQPPPIAKAPLPKPLAGPPMSVGQRALQNLPLSVAFLPEKLTQMTPG